MICVLISFTRRLFFGLYCNAFYPEISSLWVIWHVRVYPESMPPAPHQCLHHLFQENHILYIKILYIHVTVLILKHSSFLFPLSSFLYIFYMKRGGLWSELLYLNPNNIRSQFHPVHSNGWKLNHFSFPIVYPNKAICGHVYIYIFRDGITVKSS